MHEDKSAIEAVVRALGAAFNARDPKAFAALFVDDAEYVSIFGTRMRGRAAIEAGHAIVFASGPAGTRFVVRAIDTKLLSPDLALCHVPWAREKAANGPKGEVSAGTGIFTMVLTRREGPWSLAAATNVQDAPMPGKKRKVTGG